MVAPLPSHTITGTTAADIRATTPGTNALVETFQAADTITLNNEGDYALGGDGDDVIIVGGTASVSLNNSVVAGDGDDTISIASASNNFAAAAFSLGGNQGDDYITFTAAAVDSTLNGAFIGGGLNADTIAIDNISQAINTSVKGGDNGDSISMLSGTLTNTILEGNKGADTIRVSVSAATNGSVGGGAGHDTIAIGTGQASVLSWVNGGAGLDSIRVDNASVIGTIGGGGLADTISFGANWDGGKIYGDGIGETTAGTGSGGTADGNDLIGSSASNILKAASVWGAGGDDTISFGLATTGAKLYGGDGADFVSLETTNTGASLIGGNGADTLTIKTGALAQGPTLLQGDAGQDSIKVAAETALTISGGAGSDTINFTNVEGASNVDGGSQDDLIHVGMAATALAAFNGTGTVAGGDGADTIASLGFAAGGSINGGAGNDSISFGTAGNVGAWNAIGTINGGAGTDTISVSSTGGVDFGTAGSLSAGIASIAYEAGDVIRLLTTALAAGGNAFNSIIYNGSTAGFTAGYITAVTAGTLSVYSDGTDTYFALAQDTGSGIAFRVTGADLVTTAAGDNANVAATTANFGFTLSSSTSTGLTITLA